MGLKLDLSYNSQVLLHVLRKDPSVIKNGHAYLKKWDLQKWRPTSNLNK